jgi:hypothetical protein
VECIQWDLEWKPWDMELDQGDQGFAEFRN